VVARIVEKISWATLIDDEVNERVLLLAAAKYESVRKSTVLAKVLEEKYGWMWRLASKYNR